MNPFPLDDQVTRDRPTSSTVARLILEQRRLWHAGQRILVEELLRREPTVRAESEVLLDLVYHELLLRQERGERPRPDEYLARFPQFTQRLTNHFQEEAPGSEPAALSGPAGLVVPAQAGVYQILDVLGRGGAAVVYRARQLGLNRAVALKMLAGEPGDSPGQVARFRTEVEAAGRLHHPNVVQVYEVGEYQNRPFFSMELVSGGSLARKLTGVPQPAPATAELVETLARAIHAVHQAGIVHRDLKPANILLTDEGTPKITDFGVARLLNEDAHHTRTGVAIGTPSYMAPEQAAGRRREAGPAVDIHALGAVLYEMLTGRPPYRGHTAVETLQQVQLRDPVPPRQLVPAVPRDLETICLKCLEKEPHRRYATALALADDLRRFRNGEPIHARPTATVERLVKLARRHPGSAVLLLLLGTALVLLLVGGLWYHGRVVSEYQRAERQRLQAERNFRQTLLAMDELVAAAGAADASQLDAGRERLLARAQAFYGRLARENQEDPALQWEVGQAWGRIGDVQVLRGAYSDAELAYRVAIRHLESPGLAAAARRDLARCYHGYGRVQKEMSRFPDAEAIYRTALALRETLAAENRDDPNYAFDLAETRYFLGAVLARLKGRRPEAEAEYGKALDTQQQLAAAHPDRPEYRRACARTHNNLGILLHTAGRPETQQEFRRAIGLQRELIKQDPVTPDYRHELARSLTNLGAWLEESAGLRPGPQADEAEDAYDEAQTLLVQLTIAFPRTPLYRLELSAVHANLGRLLARLGRTDDAEAAYRRALEGRRKLASEYPEIAEYRHTLSLVLRALGFFLVTRDRTRDAEEAYREALGIQDKLADNAPSVPGYQADAGDTLNGLARLLYDRGDLMAARRSAEEAIRRHQAARAADPDNLAYSRGLRDDHVVLTAALLHAGKHAEAASVAESLPGLLPADLAEEQRGERVRAAEFLAQCVVAADKDTALNAEQKRQTAERYARRAVELLRQAVQQGFRNPEELRNVPAYDVLRPRDDFRALLRDLGS